MRDVYYLLKSGTLSRASESLLLTNENEKIEIPLETVESLLIFGNVSFTTPALRLLSEKNIPSFVYSERGWYITSIYPEDFLLSGHLLIKQVENNINLTKRMSIARKFVEGAANNMKVVVRRGNCGRLNVRLKEIYDANDIPSLMGVEGNIHKEYFDLLDGKLPEKFKIVERVRKPPNNYTNSMISYANSVLYGIISAQIYSTHLSPSISFLHEPFERRTSLALDVAELFKPIICDRTVLKLINLKKMNPSDFMEDKGVFLSYNGKRKLLAALDEKLRETVYSSQLRRNVSNRYLIRLELYKLEKHLLGDSEYKPYVVRT